MNTQDKFSLTLNAFCLGGVLILISAGAKPSFFIPLYLVICGVPSIIAALVRHNKPGNTSAAKPAQKQAKAPVKPKRATVLRQDAANDDNGVN